MDISIVVCTKNRASHLPQMLETLKQLEAPGIVWEIVFVDNASSDETANVLHEFCSRSGLSARVICEAKPGLSAARNAGWKSAEGKIVCFTDDDCYPSPTWLVEVDRAMKCSSADYVGGRVFLFDKNDAPVTIQTSDKLLRFEKNCHMESGHIIGANFSCTRRLLEATGGFDQRLGAGTRIYSGEDTDLMVRASLLGFAGLYDPAIVVYHHHRRRNNSEINALYSGYAYGRGALSMKTILESQAKSLYLKNWYWRMRTLFVKRKYNQCLKELQGAFHFFRISRF